MSRGGWLNDRFAEQELRRKPCDESLGATLYLFMMITRHIKARGAPGRMAIGAAQWLTLLAIMMAGSLLTPSAKALAISGDETVSPAQALESATDAGLTEDEADTKTPAASPAAIPAARQANRVAVITIRGEISRWTVYSVQRRMELAQREGADAIVFDIDTPGGEVGAVLEICTAIKNSPIPNTVAWIHPTAYSGGAIIALSCREIVVAEYATMGDALPINLVQLAMGKGLPESERQKILAPLIAEVVDSARRRGYDEKLVQGFVTLGVELWLVEHVSTGQRLFIDEDEYRTLFGEEPPRTSTPRAASAAMPSPSPSPASEASGVVRSTPDAKPVAGSTDFIPGSSQLGSELKRDVSLNLDVPSIRPTISGEQRGEWRLIEYATDGKSPLLLKSEDLARYGFAAATVQNDVELEQFFGASHMARINRSWSESAARLLSTLPVKGVLIIVFLLALFLEMASPGLGIPGTVAAVALIGLLAPPMMVGAAAWWGLASIAGGVALLIAEIFIIPGFGVFGVSGIVLLFGGLLGVVVGPGGLFPNTQQEQQQLLWGAATVLLALFTTGVGIYFISKRFGSLPVLNRMVLTDQRRDEDTPSMLEAMAPARMNGPVRVGDEGVAHTTLRPAGSAQFGDAYVDVVSEFGFVESGSRVRVTEVNEYRVTVTPVESDGGAGEVKS